MSDKSSHPASHEKNHDNGTATGSHHFLLPSPLPTKRTRTYSQSERAHAGPTLHGQVKTFCRQKGHGFIDPTEGGDPVFVHISDIEADYVLKEGDEVTYKLCSIPPKNEKCSAVHVRIVHPKEGVEHERWDGPAPPLPHQEETHSH